MVFRETVSLITHLHQLLTAALSLMLNQQRFKNWSWRGTRKTLPLASEPAAASDTSRVTPCCTDHACRLASVGENVHFEHQMWKKQHLGVELCTDVTSEFKHSAGGTKRKHSVDVRSINTHQHTTLSEAVTFLLKHLINTEYSFYHHLPLVTCQPSSAHVNYHLSCCF